NPGVEAGAAASGETRTQHPTLGGARVDQECHACVAELAPEGEPGLEVGRRIRIRLHHGPDSEPRRARERVGAPRAAPEWRATGLHRLRVHLGPVDAEVSAGESYRSVGPRTPHHLERLFETEGARVQVEPEARERLDLGPEADAELEAASRERVE